MTVPSSHRHLLDARGVGHLPNPIPLDLAELPIVRSVRNQESPDSTGELPLAARRLELTLREGRQRAEIVIEGDSRYGLPYGYDGEVLYAILALLDDRGAENGVLRDVSFRTIGSIMGISHVNQETIDRIKGALARLSNVRINTQVLADNEQAAEVLAGTSTPSVPGRRRKPMPAGVGHLGVLHVFYRELEGGTTIDYIEIEQPWVDQVISGATAWIDLPLYTSLRSPIAQRLYAVAAAYAAKGTPYPWRTAADELRSILGMPPGSADREVRRNLKNAAAELLKAKVLRRFDVVKKGVGKYEVEFDPGAALDPAILLRGAGLLDAPDARVLLMLLVSYGVPASRARTLIETQPDAAYWALSYLLYLRETEGSDTIKSPGGFLVAAIERGETFLEQRFLNWHKRKVDEAQRVLGRRPPEPPMARPQLHVDPVALPPPPPPSDPYLAELWAAARSRFLDQYPGRPAAEAYLQHLSPARVDGDTMVCHCANTISESWLRSPRVRPQLEEALYIASGGRVNRFDVQSLTA